MKNIHNKQSGYIALMSAIIISSVLMIIVFSLTFKGFMTRFNILDSEYKKRSFSLAESCLNTAILKKIQDSTYAGNETLTLTTGNCTIRPVTTSGSNYVFESRSVVQRATTNLRLTVNSSTFSTVSWVELTNF